jgi:Glycosyl transferase family 11
MNAAKSKIVVRLKGGLGNQLFCYAAARRLALANNAELILDDVTGFVRDRTYRRKYGLDHFNISARKATPAERMEPFERCRRGVMKWLSRNKPFPKRRYLEQEGVDFDGRLLALKVEDTVYLDGLWQSEGYFKDVEQAIREDLRITPPTDASNQRMAEYICNSNAVALHMRWFDGPASTAANNVSEDYYQRAIDLMKQKVETPRYFLFSDNPEAAKKKLSLPSDRVTLVSHNRGDEHAFADLWLMSQCQHFIIANSTFSWWGAWLSAHETKVVIAPGLKLTPINAWGFKGLIPEKWIIL